MKQCLCDWCKDNGKDYLLEEWDYIKNGKVTPQEVGRASGKIVYWKCHLGHSYQSRIYNRTRGGSGCPYCANRSVLKGYNDLKTKRPNLAKEWHPTKNGELTSLDIMPGSNEMVWWQCEKGHIFDATVNERTSNNTGCPICSNHRVLKGYNDLVTTYPKLAKEWHPLKNRNITPNDVISGGNKKYWWLCSQCGKEWASTISHRKNDRGCPACAKIKRVQKRRESLLASNQNLLETTPNLCKEWHPAKNGEWQPKDYTKGSNKKVWWLCCKCGQEYQSIIANRVKGVGCPRCAKEQQVSFQEKALYFYLSLHFSNVRSNFKEHFLGKFEIDIYIPEFKLGIEYDGEAWHKDIKNDKRKNKICFDNGITLIRIREPKCPNLNDTSIDFKLPTCNEEDLVLALKFIASHLKETYHCIIGNDFDITRDRSLIYEIMDMKKKNNSLAILNPKMAMEWHPTMNGTLIPENITAGSNKKVWWLCEKGHTYCDSITHRNANRNCPYCSGRRVLQGFNDLGTINPSLSKEWHPTKNDNLKPTDVTQSKGIKVWWLCPICGNEWESIIASRSRGYGCPVCGMKKAWENRRKHK